MPSAGEIRHAGNNCSASVRKRHRHCGGPDLIVESPTVDDQYVLGNGGQSFTFSAKVRNQGTVTSCRHDDALTTGSDDATIDASDTEVGTDRRAASLSAGRHERRVGSA